MKKNVYKIVIEQIGDIIGRNINSKHVNWGVPRLTTAKWNQ